MTTELCSVEEEGW